MLLGILLLVDVVVLVVLVVVVRVVVVVVVDGNVNSTGLNVKVVVVDLGVVERVVKKFNRLKSELPLLVFDGVNKFNKSNAVVCRVVGKRDESN